MEAEAITARFGPDRIGSDRFGSVRIGSGRTGSVRFGSVRTGSVRSGSKVLWVFFFWKTTRERDKARRRR
jgi:hypothetical protein